ncbi:MAG: hypothetical protein KGJ58_04290 [Patescibacteria group bacterium]|nr:hypothetical protein [Patescibacteria group bacterium]MDE1988507.1 hypothetical protein [Patescibacteria group bacterium]MDE2218637.1 hypothetical protein [Patescibacteria group bacterium]
MFKTKNIIIVLIALNLAVFGACFYLFANIKKIDKAVSERLIQIESESKKDKSLRSIKNLMNNTKKEREQIVGLFVQPNGTVDFIEAVESLGKIADVKLATESVGVDALNGKATSSAELFRLSVKTEGTWSGTIHLLSLLENMPYKVSFEKASLDKVSDESSFAKDKRQVFPYWNGDFTFNALKIKNPPEASSKIN